MTRFSKFTGALKKMGTIPLRLPIGKILGLIADLFLPVMLYWKYVAWFRKERIRNVLISTRLDFGYQNRYELYRTLLAQCSLEREKLRYLEFGVAAGSSLKWWVSHNLHAESCFVGFDTFEGLPEGWGQLGVGAFSTQGVLPEIIDTRCELHRGLFQETLPPFVRGCPIEHGRTIIHFDADLYSSTLFVFINVFPLLKRDDILMFDEFADPMHEFRAFLDAMLATSLRLRPLAAVNWGNKIAFIVC